MNIEPKAVTVKGPAARFTGDVYIDAIHARTAEPSRMACGWVHFTPGARTAWHSHAVGQTLLITEGIAARSTGTVPRHRTSWHTSPSTRASPTATVPPGWNT
jgi:hypothetical protein